MRRPLAHGVLLSLISTLLVATAPTATHAIVGGTTTSRSWAVAFLEPDRSEAMEQRIICSGALLTSTVVVTAKHCIDDILEARAKVVVGRADLTVSGGSVRAVASVKSATSNDIALVRLDSAVSQAPLPMVNSTQLRTGNDIYPYGYGRTSTSSTNRSRYLRRTTLRINMFEANIFKATWHCRAVYYGDSGGPATLYVNGREYMVGVTSATFLDAGEDPCASTSGESGIFVKTTPGGPSQAVYDWVRRYRSGW